MLSNEVPVMFLTSQVFDERDSARVRTLSRSLPFKNNLVAKDSKEKNIPGSWDDWLSVKQKDWKI